MRTHVSSTGFLPALIAAVVSLLAAAPVHALPAAQVILSQTLAKFEASVDAAGARMDVIVERAVFRIERAAAKGSSAESIQKIADKAKRSLPGEARKALAHINRDMGRGMIRMRTAAGYDREMQATLEFEREVAIADLEDLIEQASARIDEALASE